MDVGSGIIVAVAATSGRKGDTGQLPKLIEQASERLGVLADGAYDKRENFDLLEERD